jgi:hypothetical protein
METDISVTLGKGLGMSSAARDVLISKGVRREIEGRVNRDVRRWDMMSHERGPVRTGTDEARTDEIRRRTDVS